MGSVLSKSQLQTPDSKTRNKKGFGAITEHLLILVIAFTKLEGNIHARPEPHTDLEDRESQPTVEEA